MVWVLAATKTKNVEDNSAANSMMNTAKIKACPPRRLRLRRRKRRLRALNCATRRLKSAPRSEVEFETVALLEVEPLEVERLRTEPLEVALLEVALLEVALLEVEPLEGHREFAAGPLAIAAWPGFVRLRGAGVTPRERLKEGRRKNCDMAFDGSASRVDGALYCTLMQRTTALSVRETWGWGTAFRAPESRRTA